MFLNELIAALELSRLARLNVNAGSRLHDVKALLEPAYRTYDATQEEFDFAFMKNYVEGPNARYNHLSALEMFDRLHDLSCFFIDNLDMSDAVLACKAMLLLAGYSTDIPFWRKIDTRFSLAIAYSHAHCTDKAATQYGIAVEEAEEQGDLTCEYLAVKRGLILFSSLTHTIPIVGGARLCNDYWERFLSLCSRCGTTPEGLSSHVIDLERQNHPERKKYTIPRIREAEAALNVVIGFMRGNAGMEEDAYRKQKEAEAEAYGGEFCLDYRDALRLVGDDDGAVGDREEPMAGTSRKPSEGKERRKSTLGIFGEGLMKLGRCTADNGEQAIQIAKYLLSLADGVGSQLYRAVTLLAFGQFEASCGLWDEALSEFGQAVDLTDDESSPASDIDRSTLLSSRLNCEMAGILLDSSPESAIRRCDIAYAHLEGAVLGATELKSKILQIRAAANRQAGNKEAEQSDLLEALQLLTGNVRETFPFLEKSLRVKYWEQVSTIIRSIIFHVDKDSSPELVTEAYRSVLLAKGILLSTEINVRRQVMESGDDELVRQYGELSQKDIYSPSDKDENPQETFEDFVSRMRFSVGMQDILRKHSEYLRFGPEELVRQIPENAVLVDFYDALRPDGSVEYMAFLTRRELPVPIVVRVATQDEVDGYLERRDVDLVGEIYEPYSEIGQGLYRLFWEKVFDQGHVTEEDDVFFSPPGSLEQLVLEVLPSPAAFGQNCETLFRSFQRVSHAKDVKKDSPVRPERIVLFGDLDYDLSVHPTAEEEAQGLSAWEPIENSTTELEVIANRVSMLKDVSLEVFRGTEGTDKVFLSLGKDHPGIIHFLSHGFFEDAESARLIPALSGSFRPMDMTGIIVSNGNRGWLRGDYFEHEGVLTASQIAEMDLTGVRLVVLSACDLGKGEPSVSEMLGIQRAFKKAGAETVIMSLWHIEDDAVQIFVKRLYNNLLVKGMDRHRAFMSARAETRSIRELADFWAGFIMTD